jgi:hypothetical protein
MKRKTRPLAFSASIGRSPLLRIVQPTRGNEAGEEEEADRQPTHDGGK